MEQQQLVKPGSMFTDEMLKRTLEYWEQVYVTTQSLAQKQRAEAILKQYGLLEKK